MMRGNWLTQAALVALSISVCNMLPVPSLAQPAGGEAAPAETEYQPDKREMGVSMTLYHVMVGGSGQQVILTPNGQAIPLPGAGVQGHRVAVYHGTHGGTWYVDNTGKQVEIPGFYPGINGGAGYGYQATGSYYGGPYGGGGDTYASDSNYQTAYAQQPNPPQATATATASTAGGLIGSALGSAVSELAGGGGVPYGAPVYYGGGGGSYYYGGGGRHVVVNNNSVDSTHYNEWHNQQNWYHDQFKNGGRYHGNYWPGKDHGFPRPDNGGGRLYGDHRDGADRVNGGDGDHHDGNHKNGGDHRGGGHKGGGGDHHAGAHKRGGGHRK